MIPGCAPVSDGGAGSSPAGATIYARNIPTFRCKVNRTCSSFDTIRRERRPERRAERFSKALQGNTRRGLPRGQCDRRGETRTLICASRKPLARLRTKSTRGKHGSPRHKCGSAELGISKRTKLSAVARRPRAPSGYAGSYFLERGHRSLIPKGRRACRRVDREARSPQARI